MRFVLGDGICAGPMAMIAAALRLRSNRLVGGCAWRGSLEQRHGRGELVEVVDASVLALVLADYGAPQEWGAQGMLTYHLNV